jgi:alkanesulfonate monooxygenase SsuD/methylene tetrahydromethanopterin reductase-like flavin-dependent oxidoreductase (luciferase family)
MPPLERRLAIALRSPLYNGKEILEFARLADGAENVSHAFFPDIPGGGEAIELGVAALAVTSRVKAGSGVLRLHEHETAQLVRRLGSAQFLSENRFVLGIGTGDPGPHPGGAIRRMLSKLEDVRRTFETKFRDTQLRMPEVFVAALRGGIARKSITHADGLLLNFCPPSHAAQLVRSLKANAGSEDLNGKTIACYIKLFYSPDDGVARRMLVQEFANYDRIPGYHAMFEQAGVSAAVATAVSSLPRNSAPPVPTPLSDISLANPTFAEVQDLVNRFRAAGVDLPCVYPYFSIEEDSTFKRGIVSVEGG